MRHSVHYQQPTTFVTLLESRSIPQNVLRCFTLFDQFGEREKMGSGITDSEEQ